jgi:hypothetical protein
MHTPISCHNCKSDDVKRHCSSTIAICFWIICNRCGWVSGYTTKGGLIAMPGNRIT